MESKLLKRKIESGKRIATETEKDKACLAARELEALWQEFLGADGKKFFDVNAFYNFSIPDPDQRNQKMQEIILRYFGEAPTYEQSQQELEVLRKRLVGSVEEEQQKHQQLYRVKSDLDKANKRIFAFEGQEPRRKWLEEEVINREKKIAEAKADLDTAKKRIAELEKEADDAVKNQASMRDQRNWDIPTSS